MAIVEINKNHSADITRLRNRLRKLEKEAGSATLKLKVEGGGKEKVAALKKRIAALEKKSKKKAAKKKPKTDVSKHKADLKRIKEKLMKLEKKKRTANLKPTATFRTSINKLSNRIDRLLELLDVSSDDIEQGAPDPLGEKLDKLLMQNEKIAQGILTVADMLKKDLGDTDMVSGLGSPDPFQTDAPDTPDADSIPATLSPQMPPDIVVTPGSQTSEIPPPVAPMQASDGLKPLPPFQPESPSQPESPPKLEIPPFNQPPQSEIPMSGREPPPFVPTQAPPQSEPAPPPGVDDPFAEPKPIQSNTAPIPPNKLQLKPFENEQK